MRKIRPKRTPMPPAENFCVSMSQLNVVPAQRITSNANVMREIRVENIFDRLKVCGEKKRPHGTYDNYTKQLFVRERCRPMCPLAAGQAGAPAQGAWKKACGPVLPVGSPGLRRDSEAAGRPTINLWLHSSLTAGSPSPCRLSATLPL